MTYLGLTGYYLLIVQISLVCSVFPYFTCVPHVFLFPFYVWAVSGEAALVQLCLACSPEPQDLNGAQVPGIVPEHTHW